jgi:hypothetical protein
LSSPDVADEEKLSVIVTGVAALVVEPGDIGVADDDDDVLDELMVLILVLVTVSNDGVVLELDDGKASLEFDVVVVVVVGVTVLGVELAFGSTVVVVVLPVGGNCEIVKPQ